MRNYTDLEKIYFCLELFYKECFSFAVENPAGIMRKRSLHCIRLIAKYFTYQCYGSVPLAKFFCLFLFEAIFTSFFKDKKSQRNDSKTVRIKVFLTIFA
jgi:hypothetical protein